MDSDYVTIDEAAAWLEVEYNILHKFIKANKTSKAIDFRVIGDVKRYLLSDLIKIQNSSPTFDGQKTLIKKLIAPLAFSKSIRTVGTQIMSLIFAVGTRNAGGIAAYIYSEADKKRRDASAAKDIFDGIFGQLKRDCGYNFGKWYDHDGFHRDHEAAFKGILCGRPSMCVSDRCMTIRKLVSRPIRDDYVLIGGPVSTPLVRDVWQYESGRRTGSSLKRVNEPLLPLPYGFLIDDEDDRIKGMGRVSWSFADGCGQFADSPNRPLLDMRRPGRLFVPTPSIKSHIVRGEHLPVPYDNYLIITRLPNFLSEKFEGHYPHLWGGLVVIQGTHGIGTRAVGLLLTDKGKEPLLKMKASVSHAQAFQVIFRVSKPEVDLNGVDNFTNIEYMDAVVLDELIPLHNYERLRNIISLTDGYTAYM